MHIESSHYIADMQRCENVILDNLPFGFVSLKSKAQVQVERDQDYSEEFKTPIGGSVDIVCKQTFQKITIDEWDIDPDDMKMTVMCLPTYKYDIPRDNFPKVQILMKSKSKYKIFFSSARPTVPSRTTCGTRRPWPTLVLSLTMNCHCRWECFLLNITHGIHKWDTCKLRCEGRFQKYEK